MIEKSQGKPVPVKYGSSQEPSSSWVAASHSTPRSTALESFSPAASRAISAQAVCEAVEAPRPLHSLTYLYERRSSPQPPSSFWTDSSQVTARRIAGCEPGNPAATRAGTTDPVP